MKELLSALVVFGFLLMIVLGIVSLVRGRKLKTYLQSQHPALFSAFYGDGSVMGNNARLNISRLKFVHGGEWLGMNDHTLIVLASSCRAIERAYFGAFFVTIASFLAIIQWS